MAQFVVTPLEPGCPWADWARPNVKWCENNLCAWITAPANTWSNLAYLGFAYAIHRRLSDPNKRFSPTLYLYVPALACTGISSFTFHASYTRAFQVFDFFGMFCFMTLSILLNARRLHWIGEDAMVSVPTTKKTRAGTMSLTSSVSLWNVLASRFGSYYLLSLALTMLIIPTFELGLGLPIQATMPFLIACQFAQEIHLRLTLYRKHPQRRPSYARFFQSLGLLLVAVSFSAADATRIFCFPDNHVVQGHAIWHLLSATGLYFCYLFYEQLDVDRVGEGLEL